MAITPCSKQRSGPASECARPRQTHRRDRANCIHARSVRLKLSLTLSLARLPAPSVPFVLQCRPAAGAEGKERKERKKKKRFRQGVRRLTDFCCGGGCGSRLEVFRLKTSYFNFRPGTVAFCVFRIGSPCVLLAPSLQRFFFVTQNEEHKNQPLKSKATNLRIDRVIAVFCVSFFFIALFCECVCVCVIMMMIGSIRVARLGPQHQPHRPGAALLQLGAPVPPGPPAHRPDDARRGRRVRRLLAAVQCAAARPAGRPRGNLRAQKRDVRAARCSGWSESARNPTGICIECPSGMSSRRRFPTRTNLGTKRASSLALCAERL